MYEKFGQFINGKWGPSSDNRTYEVINPATGEVLGQASKATPQDVSEALNAAKNGLEIWKKTPPWQRSYIIRKIADKMREKQDVLAKWMTLEVGNHLLKQKVRSVLLQICLNGMQKRQKEYTDKLLKVDLKTQEFMFITNLLELLRP